MIPPRGRPCTAVISNLPTGAHITAKSPLPGNALTARAAPCHRPGPEGVVNYFKIKSDITDETSDVELKDN